MNRWPIVKDLFLCLSSAVLLILSFPTFNFEFLAWIGFIPLFFALKNKSKFKAFLLSYLTGIIFWLGIIYWLVHVTFIGMALLILYLALYFGFFGLIILTIDYGLWTMDFFFIPSLWVILEYIRSHLFTGFPWALLGYSQYLNLPVIQIADITGVWGVSFLVMMVNAGIYLAISHRLQASGRTPQATGKKYFFLSAFCILFALSYGYYNLYLKPPARSPQRIKISVIQGNIPQELKWEAFSKDFIIDKYLALTSRVAEVKPDLIVWPEAALPVVLEEEPLYYEKIKDFIKRAKTPLLFGAVTLKDNFYYNSAFLLSADAGLLGRYDKIHMVPFGEYIPLRKIFRFLETAVSIGDFVQGKEYTVFPLTLGPLPKGERVWASGRFSVLICFEDLFPELSRNFVKRGANFLINITNDAWFKETSSPYQHLQASVFRAVENRVYLVRSANTGVSGFIAPSGKIISLLRDSSGKNIFVDGLLTQEISVPKRNLSFYTRYGDIFVLLCIFATGLAWFRAARMRLERAWLPS